MVYSCRAHCSKQNQTTKAGPPALDAAKVENAIANNIDKATANASATGGFWGKVNVDGQTVFYRAQTLNDGTINVGTYTVGRP